MEFKEGFQKSGGGAYLVQVETEWNLKFTAYQTEGKEEMVQVETEWNLKSLIGVDIGCGMECIGRNRMEFKACLYVVAGLIANEYRQKQNGI